MKKKVARKKRAQNSPFDLSVPLETHKEYIDYHNRFDIESHKAWALEKRDNLLRKKTPLEEKRKIMFTLAHVPELKALYGIQKYLKNPDPELEAFAALAWQECQQRVLERSMEKMFGSNDFVPPLVMSGLGGTPGSLRYQFVLSTVGDRDIVKEHMEMLTRIINQTARAEGERVEEVVFRPNAIVCTSLVSHDVAIGNHIERVIAAINAEKEILRNHYFVVNTHELTDDEIVAYLHDLENEEKCA